MVGSKQLQIPRWLPLLPLLALLALCCPPGCAARYSSSACSSRRGDGASAEDLLLLFHRPAEPLITLRGVNRDAFLEIPQEYLPKRYLKAYAEMSCLARRTGACTVPIKKVAVNQSLLATQASLGFYEGFDVNTAAHKQVAMDFYHYFRAQETLDDFLSVAVWARLHFNPEMVLEALMYAMWVRKETQAVHIPEKTQIYADRFVDENFLAKARESIWLHADPADRDAVIVLRNGTAAKGGEDLLWFFREDPGLSLLHNFWHTYMPVLGDPEFVMKDRRGELFTYFHRQLIARYNANRFLLGLPRVEPLDLRQPVREGYFPRFYSQLTSTCYTQRRANTSLLDDPQLAATETFIKRAEDAILSGYLVTPNYTSIPITGVAGMDLVEDMLEAVPLLSPNFEYYGNIHTSLHSMVGLSPNPLGLYQEYIRVVMTMFSVRDPGFYQIHMLMDKVFESYRLKLTPYEKESLTLPGVVANSVRTRGAVSGLLNELRTSWLLTDLDVSLGMQYVAGGRVLARFQTLTHEPFHFELEVNNTGAARREVFVRLFLLLQQDEKGETLDMNSVQRWSMELDRFHTWVDPGLSVLTRSSLDSAVTIDSDLTYSRLSSKKAVRSVNRCRCGAPASVLLPRGSPEGQRYSLFAMLSDGADWVPPSADEVCRAGWSLCGAREGLYPDKQPMGFPFDRRLPASVQTLEDFLTPNMAVQDVVIRFLNETSGPSAFLPGGVSTSWRHAVVKSTSRSRARSSPSIAKCEPEKR